MSQLSSIVHPERAMLLAKLTAGCTVGFLALFEMSLPFMRKFASTREMRPSPAIFLSSCVGSMANALATSGFAIYSFFKMADQPVSLTMAPPEQLIWSCGITCAYFIAGAPPPPQSGQVQSTRCGSLLTCARPPAASVRRLLSDGPVPRGEQA